MAMVFSKVHFCVFRDPPAWMLIAAAELPPVGRYCRSNKAIIPANRTVRDMATTELLLKQTLSEVVFAKSGPELYLRDLEFRTSTVLVLIGEITLNKSQQDLERAAPRPSSFSSSRHLNCLPIAYPHPPLPPDESY